VHTASHPRHERRIHVHTASHYHCSELLSCRQHKYLVNHQRGRTCNLMGHVAMTASIREPDIRRRNVVWLQLFSHWFMIPYRHYCMLNNSARPVAHGEIKLKWNKTDDGRGFVSADRRQFCFILFQFRGCADAWNKADHRQHCLTAVIFQTSAHPWNWNTGTVSPCLKIRQWGWNSFIVLFQFYFTMCDGLNPLAQS